MSKTSFSFLGLVHVLKEFFCSTDVCSKIFGFNTALCLCKCIFQLSYSSFFLIKFIQNKDVTISIDLTFFNSYQQLFRSSGFRGFNSSRFGGGGGPSQGFDLLPT